MLYPKIEDCLKHIGNRYTLSSVVAKRIKELSYKMAGEFQNGQIKELTYALREIAEGKIVLSVVPHAAH
jgi:DNA-directed RNA polymerase subunit omega